MYSKTLLKDITQTVTQVEHYQIRMCYIDSDQIRMCYIDLESIKP